jgi:predicted nucleotidyltransferase
MRLREIKKDFEFIKDEVEGVLLFGSAAKGELSKRSDIDLALVRPSNKRVLFRIFERVGGKYDVKIFDELPLHIKSNQFKSVREMINQRRAWLKNERKIP